MTALKIALALFDLGAGIYRRAEARAKRKHKRETGFNAAIRGVKDHDGTAYQYGIQRLRRLVGRR